MLNRPIAVLDNLLSPSGDSGGDTLIEPGQVIDSPLASAGSVVGCSYIIVDGILTKRRLLQSVSIDLEEHVGCNKRRSLIAILKCMILDFFSPKGLRLT